MLLELSIKNFAIIDYLRINFTKGLNVITGETGSGKSIIIEALGVVLGGRGTKELIRTGESKAILQAIFVLEDKKFIKPLLDENGITLEDDNLLIITREIPNNSPSISRINDKVVTLSILNTITQTLIDIFAQDEHQSLLNTGNHKIIIDSFGDEYHKSLKLKVKSLYEIYINEKKKLDEMNIGLMERERLIDLYKFQLNEIDSVRLSSYDDEEIENDYNKLTNIVEIIQGIGEIVESFNNENYGFVSIFDHINRNISILNNLTKFDSDLIEYLNRFKDVNYELQDLNNEFLRYIDNIQLDEERLDKLTERLDIVNKLKKKYGNTVSKILEYRDSIEESLNKLLNYEKEIEKLTKRIAEHENKLNKSSKELSESRKSISLLLEKNITKELNELNMHNVNFEVDFKEKKNYTSDGIDSIEFLISTNIGESLKPLSKIASGGEMSRIMLGFKSILAKYDSIATMIFDEIDTGISGRTAQIVSEKIYNISRDRQVISVTHLPQIAAIADTQFSINKETKNEKVSISIKKLNEEDRVFELAKIIGGVDLTDTTINHAKEMLLMANKLKKSKF